MGFLPLTHAGFFISQGVIDLEALGKKGYSVPKAGTIQVVSCSVISSDSVGRALSGLWLPPGWNVFHYVVCQGSSQKACAEGVHGCQDSTMDGNTGSPGCWQGDEVMGDAGNEEVGGEGQGLTGTECTCSGDGARECRWVEKV